MKKIYPLFILTLSLMGYAQNGELDLSFNGDGKYFKSNNSNHSYGRSVDLSADQSILIGATVYNFNGGDLGVLKLDRYGNPDLSFGNLGQTLVDFEGEDQNLFDVDQQLDEKIILGGVSSFGDDSGLMVSRLRKNGQLDLSFGDSGVTFIKGYPNFNLYNELLVLPNQQIIAAGTTYNDSLGVVGVLNCLKADGAINENFADSGLFHFNVNGYSTFFNALAKYPDGSFLVGGSVIQQSKDIMVLLKMKANGTLDVNFGGNGVVTIPQENDAIINDIELTDDDKILLGANSSQNSLNGVLLVRLNASGTLDQSFGVNGQSFFQIFGSYTNIINVHLLADDKIMVSAMADGIWNRDFALIRFYEDGSLDKTFSHDGFVTKNIGTGDDTPAESVLQPDGRLIITGYCRLQANGYNNIAAARFLAGKSAIGAAEFFTDDQFRAYPNPAFDQLTLETGETWQNGSVQLHRANGQLVLVEDIEGDILKLELAAFPAGIYLLTLKDESKSRLAQHKIVIR